MDKTKFRPIGVENDKADNSVIAPVESGTTASQAYAIGAHFIRDSALCTAKTAIAQGETFRLNTNYTAGDIGSILNTLEKKIYIKAVAPGNTKTFSIRFTNIGNYGYALIYGRFSWDPAKLSMAVIFYQINSNVPTAYVQNLGAEGITVAARAGGIVDITLAGVYAYCTIISSLPIE